MKNETLQHVMNPKAKEEAIKIRRCLNSWEPSEATYDPTDRSPLYDMECDWEYTRTMRKDVKDISALLTEHKFFGQLQHLLQIYYHGKLGKLGNEPENIDADGVNLYDRYDNFYEFANHKYRNVPNDTTDFGYAICVLHNDDMTERTSWPEPPNDFNGFDSYDELELEFEEKN